MNSKGLKIRTQFKNQIFIEQIKLPPCVVSFHSSFVGMFVCLFRASVHTLKSHCSQSELKGAEHPMGQVFTFVKSFEVGTIWLCLDCVSISASGIGLVLQTVKWRVVLGIK